MIIRARSELNLLVKSLYASRKKAVDAKGLPLLQGEGHPLEPLWVPEQTFFSYILVQILLPEVVDPRDLVGCNISAACPACHDCNNAEIQFERKKRAKF